VTEIRRDTGKFKSYRYGIQADLVPKGGKEEDVIRLGPATSELRLMKHYDEQVFPYFRLTVAVSVEDATKIQSCWRNGRLYITLKEYLADTGDESGNADDTGRFYLKNGEFRIMVCDGSPAHVPDGEYNEMARNLPSILFRMELIPVLALGMNKAINNGAYHEVTTADLVALLTAQNAPKDSGYELAMSPGDNDRVYESIFCPPLNYVQALRHIDRVYGLYKGRLQIFLDVDRGYILSSTKLTERGPKDPTTVFLEVMSPEEASPNSSGAGSAYEEDSLAFRLRTAQRIEATFDGPVRREVSGDSVKLVWETMEERVNSEIKDIQVDSVGTEEKELKERVLWQKYDNKLTPERVKIDARERYAPATVRFRDCDLQAFGPTIQWMLVSELKRTGPMEGVWRISAMEAVLTKAPGTDETANVEVAAMILPSAAE
jgi:hypothetical protein